LKAAVSQDPEVLPTLVLLPPGLGPGSR
jgi:hypothetical protein